LGSWEGAKLRRDTPSNGDVLAVCAALERLLTTAKPVDVTARPNVDVTSSCPVCEARRYDGTRREGACSVHIVDPALAETLLATYGYAAIFALVMLESAGIPLPGETILVSASKPTNAKPRQACRDLPRRPKR
jgi:hypothetical protein